MFQLEDILTLGDERLYQVCRPVERAEIKELLPALHGMSELVVAFRKKHGWGRAIAAPQVGIFKRVVVLHIDRPVFMLNPELSALSPDTFTLWDDCMSFPGLWVRVKRHRKCTLQFRDVNWEGQVWQLGDSLSELLQHECDHLDGVLATMRTVDDHSFRITPPAGV